MLIIRRLPLNFDNKHKDIFDVVSSIELPKPYYSIYTNCAVLKNGIVINLSGIKKQSLLYDIRLKEIGGYLMVLKMFTKELLNGRFKFIKKNRLPIVTVINEWSNNYFHWLTEVLPKIYFLKKHFSEFTILIPSNFTAEYQITSLKLMNVSFIYFEGMALLRKGYLPSRQAPYSAHYNPEIIKGLSNEIRLKIDLSFHVGSYIYITRCNAKIRKILNENEVIDLLRKYGFKVVEFESLSFQQQVSLSYYAEIIVSIHGAGLTNMIFCKPGTVVLEFSLKNQILDKCYYTLSDVCDLSYYYQFCNSADSSIDYYSANLIVDIKLLEQNIIQILEKK